MGILDRLRGKGGSTIAMIDDPLARAVLTPAVSTMVGDGEVNEAENAQLNNLLSFSPIFRDHGPAAISAMVQYILESIQKIGHEATIQQAAQELSPEMRRTALCFAMRIALADGRIEDGERASLSQTGHHLGIPPEEFGQIFEVMLMLQRGRP